jgi:hypothetical protein
MRSPSPVTIIFTWSFSLSSGRLLYGRFQFLLELVHVVLAYADVLARAALPGADFRFPPERIVDVSRHGLFYGFARAHQPEHNEERHHRGNEIRVSHFPRSAVMAGVDNLLLDDDRLNGDQF